MQYCTDCAHPLTRRRMDDDRVERYVCSFCGRVHYENPKVLVSCFASWKDRLLLCRRAHEPAQGLWNLPSGFVEMGESLEEAAARETMEEVGVQVPPSSMILYRVTSIPHINEIHVGFRAALPTEPRLVLGTEATEARFWSEKEFPVEQLAFREMLHDMPEDFFRGLRTGEFPIASVTLRPAAPSSRKVVSHLALP
jgi:ADP-ribose pyrophosphatase YjhB (NUDIX family)